MPTYEYQCDDCGDEFEKEQRITEPAGAVCPECGSSKTHRLISHTSFVLKGSGWYVTDYGRKGSNGSGDSSSVKSKGNGGNGDGDTGKDPSKKQDSKVKASTETSSGSASSSKSETKVSESKAAHAH